MKPVFISILNPGIWWRSGHLGRLLRCSPRIVFTATVRAMDSVWIGWGYKRSGRRAQRLALKTGSRYWLLEDGFLRSVGLGRAEPPLSIVVDDLGIYYDANHPSRLERMITRPLTSDEQKRAQELCHAWRVGGVSKYNHQRNLNRSLPPLFVLVVDQTMGDASIIHGQASAESFTHMLNTALEENPDSTILIKIHPEVFSGRKRGYFDLHKLRKMPRIFLLAEEVHPADLIERASKVYVVTSQIGFEGLMFGKPVRTFGMPFYAGWGLTEDALPAPTRRKKVFLEQLVHAALIDYPRYLDPESGIPCTVERVIDYLSLQRRMRERFPRKLYAYDFSPWKRPIVRNFCNGSDVCFVNTVQEIPESATLLIWGKNPVIEMLSPSISVFHIEDGFLRSVGLGADLVKPLSWVIDRRGIYYDAREKSDLESILEYEEFSPTLLERAKFLRNRIVAAGLTKYNVGEKFWEKPKNIQPVILVPGQVESDSSIKYSTGLMRTNLDLLQAVRNANPSAYLLYKPHPDVLAGLRASGVGEERAREWCDELVTDIAMGKLLDLVDEVHVLTSLSGFEALLRGKSVTTYGLPFYAGWGLTHDFEHTTRRTRRLTLDELVAGALLLYPTYISRTTGKFTTAERALDELLEWRDFQGKTGLPWWRKPLRAALRLFLPVR